MANKAGNSKAGWTDSHKKSNAAADTLRRSRKEKRVAAQKEREKVNKGLAPSDRPWAVAKAARKASRVNVAMQPRTGLGNIVQKQPDGTTRIIPGTSLETEAALKFRAEQREAEIREATKKKVDKAKKKANADKANAVHKQAS